MQLNKVGLGSNILNNNTFNKQPRSTMNFKGNNDNKTDEKVINANEVKTVVSKINGYIDPNRTNLQFKYHEELNEYYVTVVNPLTNELVKEIPPKKMLDVYAAMVGFMGLLIDEKI